MFPALCVCGGGCWADYKVYIFSSLILSGYGYLLMIILSSNCKTMERQTLYWEASLAVGTVWAERVRSPCSLGLGF